MRQKAFHTWLTAQRRPMSSIHQTNILVVTWDELFVSPKKQSLGQKQKVGSFLCDTKSFHSKNYKNVPHRWIHSRVIKGFVCVWCLLKIEHDKSLFDNNLASYLGYLEAVGMVWNHLGGWKQYPEIGIPTIVIFCSPKFLPRKDGHLLDVTIVQPERIAMSYSPSKNINSVLMV